MKMKLNAALRAALLACYAVTAPIATTVSTGAFITGAVVYTLSSQAQAASGDAWVNDSTESNTLTDDAYASVTITNANDTDYTLSLNGNTTLTTGLYVNRGDFTLDSSTEGADVTLTTTQFGVTWDYSTANEMDVTIDSDVTLYITGTSTTAAVGSASFVVSRGGSSVTTLNIDGTIISDAGISSRDGSATINVNDGGTLQLNAGLIATRYEATDGWHGSSILLNVEEGGTLSLGDQTELVVSSMTFGASYDYSTNVTVNSATTESIMTVTMADGSKIIDNGVSETTSFYTTLSFEDGATVGLATSGSGQTLNVGSKLTGTGIEVTGEGTVQLSGGADLTSAALTSGTLAIASAASIGTTTVAAGASLDISSADAALTGGITLAGGSLTVGAELSNTITFTAASSIVSDDGSVSLNGTITYEDSIYALDLLSLSSVTVGDDFLLDFGSVTIDGSSVAVFTDATEDFYNSLAVSDFTSSNYSIESLVYDDGTISAIISNVETITYIAGDGYFYDSDGSTVSDVTGANLVLDADNNSNAQANITGTAYSISLDINSYSIAFLGSVFLSETSITIDGTTGTIFLGNEMSAKEGISLNGGTLEFGTRHDSSYSTYEVTASITSDITIADGATLKAGNTTYTSVGSDSATITMGADGGSITYNALTNATLANTNIAISGDMTYTNVAVADSSAVTVTGGTLSLDKASTFANAITVSGGSINATEGTLSAAISVAGSGVSISSGLEDGSLVLDSTISYSGGTVNSLAITETTSLGENFSLDLSGVTAGSYTIFTGASSELLADASYDTDYYLGSYSNSEGTVSLALTASEKVTYNISGGYMLGADGSTTVTDVTNARVSMDASGNSSVSTAFTGKAYSIDFTLSSGNEVGFRYNDLLSSTTINITGGSIYTGGEISATNGITLDGTSVIFGTRSNDSTDTFANYQAAASITSDVTLKNGASINTGDVTFSALDSTADATITMGYNGGSIKYNTISNATFANIAMVVDGGGVIYTSTLAESSSIVIESGTLQIATSTLNGTVTVNGGTLALDVSNNYNGTITMNAGTLQTATGSIDADFRVAGAGVSLSNAMGSDASVTLNSTISYEGGELNSLNLSGAGVVSIGDDFVLDLSGITLDADISYTVFTNLGNDLSTESIAVSNANYDNTNYEIVWSYEGNGLSFSLSELMTEVLWDSTTGYVTGGTGDYSAEAITIDTTGIENATLNTPTVIVEEDDGSYSELAVDSLTITGDSTLTIKGNSGADSSWVLADTVTVSTDVVLETSLYVEDSMSVTGSTVTLNGDWWDSLDFAELSLDAASSVVAGGFTAVGGAFTGTGEDGGSFRNTSAQTLTIKDSAITISGNYAFDEVTLDESSTVMVNGSLLTFRSSLAGAVSVVTGGTLFTDNASLVGSLTLAGGKLNLTEDNASLSATITLSADSYISASYSQTNTLELNGTISYRGDGSIYSLTVEDNTAISIGESFYVDIASAAASDGSYSILSGVDSTILSSLSSSSYDSNNYLVEWSVSDSGDLVMDVTESNLVYSNPYATVLYDADGSQPTSSGDTSYTQVAFSDLGENDRLIVYSYAGNTSFGINNNDISCYSIELGDKENNDSYASTVLTFRTDIEMESKTTITKYDESTVKLTGKTTAAEGIFLTNGTVILSSSTASLNSDTTITGDAVLNSSYYSITATDDATAKFSLAEGGSITWNSISGATVTGAELDVLGNMSISSSSFDSTSSISITAGTLSIDNASTFANAITVNGGTVNATEGTLNADLTINANAALSSSTGSLVLNSDITYAGDYSLSLSGSEVSLGSGFSLDLSSITLDMDATYTVFTHLSSDLSGDTNWEVSLGSYNSVAYDATWTLVGDELVLSFTEVSSGDWSDGSYDISGGGDTTTDLTINTDDTDVSGSATINTGGTEGTEGTTSTGTISITGNTAVSIEGENDLASTTITIGDVDNATDVTVSTGVSASEGIDVVSGSVTVDGNGMIDDSKVTLADGTTLKAGNIVIAGTGSESSVEGTIKSGNLTETSVEKALVTVTGDASLTDTTISSDSVLAVEKGTLSIDSDTVIKAGETTIADGASISGNTSSISITGNDGGATIVLDPDGSFGDGSIVNATVTNASLTIGAAPVINQIIGFSMGISTMSLGEPTTYDQWIENSTLTTTTITMNGTSLGMDTVTISADTSFDFTGTSTIDASNLTLNKIDASNLTLNTGDVTLDATSGTLTIGTFSGVDAMSIEGSLTINIVLSDTELAEFASMLASKTDVAFIVAGVDDYVSADVELIIGSTTNSAAYSYSSTSGGSITDGDLTITVAAQALIPEPSTATLSLLALAGLLARRRRRQA